MVIGLSWAPACGQDIVFGRPFDKPVSSSSSFIEIPANVPGSDVVLLRGGDGQSDCRDPDRHLGRCGVFQECRPLTSTLLPLTTGSVRYLRRSICRFKGGQAIVCCPHDPPRLEATTAAPPSLGDESRPTPPAPTEPGPTAGSGTETATESGAGGEVKPTEPAEVETSTATATEVAATTPAEPEDESAVPPTGTEAPVQVVDAVPGTVQPDASTTSASPEPSSETMAPDADSAGAGADSTTEAAVEAEATAPPAEMNTAPPATTTAVVDSTTPASAGDTTGEPGAGSAEPGQTNGLRLEEDGRGEPVAPPGLDTCGYRNVSANRIIGGRIAEPNAWPWLAALGYEFTENKIEFFCGGALLTDQHVLTAAHCIKPELKTVRLGDHDLFNETEVNTVVEHPVLASFPHQEYNNRTLFHDIAIIKLRTRVKLTDAVHPVCLPIVPEMRELNLVRKTAFIAGWGTTKFKGEASEVLREATVRVHRQQLCKQRYRALRHKIIDNQMCASSKGQDSCQGDSGGPMLFPGRVTTNWYVMGVVSFGLRCGEPRFPGVYTRVVPYLDWITDNLR
ncbi:clotting factor B-like isoform X2 [Pollicipes pollicipes]|nr:clotting factor B-like isoform X2 [Pollicipes pollicipes]